MQRVQRRHEQPFVQLIDTDNDESDIEERFTGNGWSGNEVSHSRTIFPSRDDVNESFQARGFRKQIHTSQLGRLSKGNHIGWHRPYMIWHHAIVLETDHVNKWIRVIHFTKVDGKAKVVKEWINADKQKGDLFLFEYPAEVTDANPAEKVLQRAYSRLDENDYGIFSNNCEHFATYCKTGIEDSAQVHWAWKKVKETFHACAGHVVKSGTKLGYAVAKGASTQTYRSIAEGTGKVMVSETAEHVAKASNWTGAGLIVGIEAVHCGWDIYKLNKNRRAGKISERDFKVSTTQRVSEGVVGGGLAIGGSFFGEWLSGIVGGAIGSFFAPVIGTAIGAGVGAFVGSIVCGAIGSIAGKMLGSIFGNWFGRKLFREEIVM